jgi:hypothetical protein
VAPTFRIKDPEEQIKARQELLEGALKDKLDLLSKLVVSRLCVLVHWLLLCICGNGIS